MHAISSASPSHVRIVWSGKDREDSRHNIVCWTSTPNGSPLAWYVVDGFLCNDDRIGWPTGARDILFAEGPA